MDPLTTGSLIAAGTQLVGQGINWASQGNMNKKTREWNQRMMNYQNNWNYELWKQQNEYNSPANQMKRFKEAGLNPHLIYGKGESGNATNIQSAKPNSWQPRAPQISMPDIMAAMSMYQDIRFKDEQIINQAYLRRKISNQADLYERQKEGQRLSNQLFSDTYQYQSEAWKIKVAKLEAEVARINSSGRYTSSQADWAEKRLQVFIDTGIDIGRDNSYLRILENMFGGMLKEYLSR